MRKIACFALAVAAAAGCSGGPETLSSELAPAAGHAEGATATETQAFAKLATTTGAEWTWLPHEKHRTPAFLEASLTPSSPPVIAKGGAIDAATLRLLDDVKPLFRMREPRAELRLERTEVDALGMTHVRFRQVTRGIPVVGAQLGAHFDAAGRVSSIAATYIPDLDAVDLEPRLDRVAAARAVREDVLAQTPDVDEAKLEASEPELVVFALGEGPARLAYEQRVRAVFGREPAIWVTTVDARTGAVIDRYNNLMTVEASGRGVLGDTKKFEVAEASGAFAMTDTSRGVTIRTHDAAYQEATAFQGAQVESSSSLTAWDTGVVGAGATVDAHAHASIVFDYYKQRHQRNAIDGAGGPMVSTAHFGSQLDNAFWDGRGMAYGDGADLFRPLSAGLDVVAHEFTHGVTERTSNLRYQGQSGALNEAVSDIFGAFVEHFSKGEQANWSVGEAVSKSGQALRDMKNPSAGLSAQPAHMTRFVNTQQDNGGVHINSGIVNQAAFLMTAGGVNPVSKVDVKYGIGWDKSEKVWFRAVTTYFQETTDFAGAAQMVARAAKDLELSQAEQDIVDCAFKAVGMVQGSCATLVDPAAETPAATDEAVPTAGEVVAADEAPAGDQGPIAPNRRTRALASPQAGACSVATATGNGAEASGATIAALVAALALAATRRRKR